MNDAESSEQISDAQIVTEINASHIRRWLLDYAQRIEEKQDYLTELDTAIGDADHGTNMRRGTEKVRTLLDHADGGAGGGGAENDSTSDVGMLLRSIAMTLINSIGGAAGPLYGSFFLHAGREASGQSAITLHVLAKMFRTGLEGIKQRGKAVPGDKTMIDALEPAVQALEDAVTGGETLPQALVAMRDAAHAGMSSTVEMQARRGRASYLGPRSIGHQDPGATSTYYMIETAAQAAANSADS